MADPVQTVPGSVTGNSGQLALAFAHPTWFNPTVGNRLIVAAMVYSPYPFTSGMTISDSGSNVWTDHKTTSFIDSHANSYTLAIRSAPITSSAGSPFTVTVAGANSPSAFLQAVCFECGSLNSTQPDATPTFVVHSSGSSSVTPATQSGTQSNDFAVALVCFGGNDNWTAPAGWTTPISNANTGHPINGSVNYLTAPTFPVGPSYTGVTQTTIPNGSVFVLFQGNPGTTTTFSYSASGSGSGVLVPAFTTAGVPIATYPLSGAHSGVLPPQMTARSWFNLPIFGGGEVLPVQLSTSGSLVLKPPLTSNGGGVLPPSFFTSGPALQVKRGPQTTLSSLFLKEGEFYLGGNIQGGTTYEVLFIGGHDGNAKGIGGALQTVSGIPSWTPSGLPAGCVQLVYDSTNSVFYVAGNGGPWVQV